MITMINERNGNKIGFKNYHKLYSYLDSRQRAKRFNPNRPHQPINDWFFACHSYSRIMALHKFVCIQKANTKETKGSVKPKFDVLEMSYDLSNKTRLIPITPNLDIESLLEDWCRRYCEAHGYKLVEVQNDDGILHVKKPTHYPSNETVGINGNIWSEVGDKNI